MMKDDEARSEACRVPADSSAARTAHLELLETLSLLGPNVLGFMGETLDQALPQETASSFATDSHQELGQLT